MDTDDQDFFDVLEDSNAFFNDIICEDYSESENEENNADGKENRTKITVAQSNKLITTMAEWKEHILKGSMKLDVKQKLLDQWEKLTPVLNSLGPPTHTSLKWRRIWTKLKSRRKHGAPVLCSQSVNKKVKRKLK